MYVYDGNTCRTFDFVFICIYVRMEMVCFIFVFAKQKRKYLNTNEIANMKIILYAMFSNHD